MVNRLLIFLFLRDEFYFPIQKGRVRLLRHEFHLLSSYSMAQSTHVCRGEGEDTVKVLNEFLEGGPLGGLVAPTLPHDHVAAVGKVEAL